jgi:hypothetical protein
VVYAPLPVNGHKVGEVPRSHSGVTWPLKRYRTSDGSVWPVRILSGSAATRKLLSAELIHLAELLATSTSGSSERPGGGESPWDAGTPALGRDWFCPGVGAQSRSTIQHRPGGVANAKRPSGLCSDSFSTNDKPVRGSADEVERMTGYQGQGFAAGRIQG